MRRFDVLELGRSGRHAALDPDIPQQGHLALSCEVERHRPAHRVAHEDERRQRHVVGEGGDEGPEALGVVDRRATGPDPTGQIAFDDFLKVDIRVGTIVEALPFPEARKPAFRLMIDFGPELGIKKSSVQITKNYELDDLVGRQVAAVVNFPPRQIGPLMSEVLTLGFPDKNGEVVMFAPDLKVPDGGRLF